MIGTEDGGVHAFDAATGEDGWSADTGEDAVTSVVVRNGVVYAVAAAQLVALDAATGNVRWTVAAADGGAFGPPSVDGSLVYVGSAGGGVQAFKTADGTAGCTWDGIPASSMTLAEDAAYVIAADGTARALDRTSGQERWSVDLGGPVATAAVVGAGHLIATNPAGDVLLVGP